MPDKSSIWFLYVRQRVPVQIKGIRINAQDIASFTRNVTPLDNTLCWEWAGCTNNAGYGVCYIGSSTTKGRRTVPVAAHRLSWILANQKNIPDGQMIRHDCDNPRCVNPHHLRPGTHSDNMNDAKIRCRMKGSRHNKAKGEGSGRSKLTEAAVQSIRERYAAGGVTQKALGAEYGVTKSTICGVLNGRVWGHLA